MVRLWGGASGGAELSGPGCKDHNTAHSQGFTVHYIGYCIMGYAGAAGGVSCASRALRELYLVIWMRCSSQKVPG